MKTDWRALYAANRAGIREAGVSDIAMNVPLAPVAPPRARQPPPRAALDGATAERHAVLHVPPGLRSGTAVPLVCMLHGCTQTAASFAAATRMNEAADRYGFVVVYAEQGRAQNPQGCWNWFLEAHQSRDRGEPMAIATIVRELIGSTANCTIDARRVFVAGISAGGAMAAILAATYPDVFAAVAVHSGLAFGSARNVNAAFAAMASGAPDAGAGGAAMHAAMGARARPVPSIVVHGSADRTVAPINGEQVLRQAMAANRLADRSRCNFDPARPSATDELQASGGLKYTRSRWLDARGALMHEAIAVEGLGHAWSGGVPGGSFTDPRGPSATEAIWRFFARATADPAG
jgi:poly(hydroxyalkanoate) depolymerase family esterase